QRLESERDQDRRGDRDRRPETRCAFKERAKAKRHEQQLQAAIGCDAGDAFLQHVEETGLVGEDVHEDHVEHDPANREQSEQRSIERRLSSHFGWHAEREDRDRQRDDETQNRRKVRLDVEKCEASQQYDDRQSRSECGKPFVAEWIVDLRPAHFSSPFRAMSRDDRTLGAAARYAKSLGTFLIWVMQWPRRRCLLLGRGK